MAATDTARQVINVSRDRELPFMAAAIAHYTLASLVPLLLFAVAMAALLGSEQAFESFVQEELGDVLSQEGQDLVVSALSSATGAAGAGFISIAFTFWSASKIFRGLEVAFTELYDVETTPSLFEQLRDAAVVIALLALAIALMIASGVVVSTVDLPIPFPGLWGTILLFGALVIGLLPIYYVLTPIDVELGDILPGTVLAAGGLVVLQVLFVVYAQQAGRYKTLGMLGALLLFVTWLYFGGIVVLLGGALNYVTGADTVWTTNDPAL
jgi:membrane protein